MKPRLLDLFCGAGGAAMGYHRAGFDVTGVDIAPQPDYPFNFVQADAPEYLSELVSVGPVSLQYDAIHASPPCQAHTAMSNRWRGKGGAADMHVDLIPGTRESLALTELPYVIENVVGARRSLRDAQTLTGEMFGLVVHRPRLFETNWTLSVPPKPPSSRSSIGVYGAKPDGRLLWRRKDGSEQRAAISLAQAQEAMRMPWASWRGCCEAVPPAYTEFIGKQLLAVVGSA